MRPKSNDVLMGVRVSDDDVKKEKEENNVGEQKHFVVFGDIELDEDEISYANIPYKFVEYEDVEERKLKVSAEKHSVTERWELWDNDKVENENKDEMAERKEKSIKEKKMSGEVFDRAAGRVDLSKLRVTDIPTNTRVFEPRAASGPEEVKIQLQKNEVLETCREYVKRECFETGKVKNTNLTSQQIIGKKKLKRRVKQNEIVIFLTDKSGKLAICTPETYQEAAKVHIDKDTEVPWDTLKQTETLVNRHVKQLVNAFSMGSTHRQEDRIHKALRAVDVAHSVG